MEESKSTTPVKVCRLCLARGFNVTMRDIFELYSETNLVISDIITKCAPVQISRYDGLSGIICDLCYAELERVNRFQMRAVDSQRIAHQFQQKNEFPRNPNQKNLNSVAKITVGSINNNIIDPNSKNKTLKVSEGFGKNNKLESVNNDQQTKCLKRSIFDENDQNSNFKPKQFKANYVQLNVSPKKSVNFNKENETNAIQQSQCHFKVIRNDILNQKDQNVDITNNNVSAVNIKTELPDEFDNFSTNNEMSAIPSSIETENMPIKSEIVANIKKEFSTCNRKEDSFIGINTQISVGITNVADPVDDPEFRSKADEIRLRKMLNKKRHKCDVCNRCFIELDNLKVHRLNHTDGILYVCDFCNEVFADAMILREHETLHSRK